MVLQVKDGSVTYTMIDENMIIALRFAIREEMNGVIRASEQRVGEQFTSIVEQLIALQQLLEKAHSHRPDIHLENVTVMMLKENTDGNH